MSAASVGTMTFQYRRVRIPINKTLSKYDQTVTTFLNMSEYYRYLLMSNDTIFISSQVVKICDIVIFIV